jgi:serine/threonine-protein kinase/endoribonuclease IRE1
MLSRPLGETRHSGNPKLLLAFAVFLLPWLRLVNADAAANVGHADKASLERAEHHDEWTVTSLEAIRDAQETLESSDREQHPPNHESSQKRLQHAKARAQARAFDTEQDESRVAKLRNKHNIKKPDDASALATFAPAPAVRAPHSSGHKRSSGAHASGVASPQIARSLGDWEVEDFVLLATVDGNLFASDRNTGKEIWRLQVDQPMVETKHYRANISTLDDDYDAVDHYIWAVEPNRDGSLYVWIPDSAMGLVRTGFTMKHLVEELSPYAGEQPPVVYTGDKKTSMITLDAATGQVLKWFGPGGSHSEEAESCLRPNGLHGAGPEECSSTGTITLGRVEYTVAIHRSDLKPIATLKYSEWVPNNFDNDLFQQYHQSRDDRYISSKHDGKVYAFDFRRSKHGTKLYSEKFSSPVARVFDVCRPWDAPLESNPPLVILPQPPMPTQEQNEEMSRARDNRIFLNHTEDGGWFALSGQAYPLVVDAPVAQIAKVDWSELGPVWDTISEAQVSRVLVGTHYLDNFQSPAPGNPLTLPPPGRNPEIRDKPDKENDSLRPPDPPTADINATLIDKVKSLPQSAANSVVDFISNPILIILFFGALIYNEKKLRQGYGQFRRRKSWREFVSHLLNDGDKYRKGEYSSQEQTTSSSVHEQVPDSVDEAPNHQVTTEHNEFGNESSKEDSTDSPPQELAETDAAVGQGANPDSESKTATSSAGPEKKKKAHRGRRGGVKHKKGKGRENSLSRNDEPNSATVEEAVNNAKKLGDRPAFEPDVMTVANDMQAVTGPIIRMGNIEVDTEDQLGTGSNGTLVFAGKFDGREVAVKRMLIQFYDIASQETRLLRESDDHPNGTFASSYAKFVFANPAASDSLLLSTNSRWVLVHCFGKMCSLTRRCH